MENPHDNVSLIQKCNLILKTAGLKTTIKSYEQLELAAPVLFIRIFEALYCIKLHDVIASANVHSHAADLNSVLHILRDQRPSHLLHGVTGDDIVRGVPTALQKVIEYYFDEVQIRLEKLAQHTYELDSEAKPKFVAEHHRSLKKGEDRRREMAEQHMDRASSKSSPIELLTERVAHLEKTLQSNRQPEAARKSPSKKRKKKPKMTVTVDNPEDVTTQHILTPTKAEDRADQFETSRRKRMQRKEKHNTAEEKTIQSPPPHVRAQRPTSAPLGGRKYRVAANRPQSRDDVRRCTSEEAAPSPVKKYTYSSDYTYDLISGRRISIEQAKKLRQQQEEYKSFDAPESPKKKDAHEEPTVTVPRWPGYSTQRSVAEWLEKSKQDREGGKTTVKKLPPAHIYPAYAALENLDMVVTVEHCFKCSRHSISLRHDEKEYATKAENALRAIAQIIHSNHSCVRLGVSRFCAQIGDDGRTTDANSRIGALEIQIAYRKPNGELVSDLLHSKLYSQHWPSKSVLEKRLRAFMSQAGIQTHLEQHVSEMEQSSATGGLSKYPVGITDWLQTPIADPLWRYMPPDIQVGEPADGDLFMKQMQWVFDTRALYTHQHLPAGTLVSIVNYERPSGEVEPLGVLGTLKQIYKDPKTMVDMAIVQLRHTEEDVTCEALRCVEARKANNTLLEKVPTRDVLPAPLSMLLMLADRCGITEQWTVLNESVDKFLEGSLFLCQASFFRTINDTVWAYVHHAGLENAVAVSTEKHSYTFNLHLAYSEDVLNWVFRKYGRSINVMKLLDMVREPARESHLQVATTSTPRKPIKEPPVSPLSPTEIERRNQAAKVEKEQALVSETIAHVAQIIKKESFQSGDEMGIVHNLRHGLRGVCLRLSEASNDDTDDVYNDSGDDLSYGLEKFFRAYDNQHNGEIPLLAFRQTLEQFGLSYSDSDLQCLWATLDRDGSKSINFNELLSFLNTPTNKNTRELGELWCIVWDNILALEGTGNDDDDKENSTLLASLEDDLYQECGSKYCVVSGDQFLAALRKVNIISHLSNNDIIFLVSSFCDMSSEVSTLQDASHANVLFEDFFSWLQPVDIKQVAKRVIRFLKAIFQHEKGLDMGIDSDADMFKKLDPTESGKISKNDFRSCVCDFGLPVSCAEVRTIFLHFGSRGFMTYEQFRRLLSTKRNEIPPRQQSPDVDQVSYENDFDGDAPLEQRVDYSDVIVALKSFNVAFDAPQPDLLAGELTVGITFQDFYQEETLQLEKGTGNIFSAKIGSLLSFTVSADACTKGEMIDVAIRHDGAVIFTDAIPSAAVNDADEVEVPISMELKSRVHGACKASGVFVLSDPVTGDDIDVVISQFNIVCNTSKFNALKRCSIGVRLIDNKQEEIFDCHSVDNRQCVFVEWPRIHVAPQTIASRQKIEVMLFGDDSIRNREDELFSGCVPLKLMKNMEKNISHDIPVACISSKFDGMSVTMTLKLCEAQSTRATRIQSMDGKALAALRMKSLHSDGEDDVHEEDHGDLFDLGSSFMGSFNERDASPREQADEVAEPTDEAERGVLKEFSMIDQSLFNNSTIGKQDLRSIPELVVRFAKIHVKDLKNIELFGKNDPFVNLTFGEWNQRTTTREDAGSDAEWVYDVHDHNMLFEASGRELDEIPLRIEVFDENSLVKSKLIGSGDVHVRQSGKLHVELFDAKGERSGAIELDVTVDLPEPHLVSGVLQLNRMGFMLKTKKKSPKRVRVAMTLGYWHHALETTMENNVANWAEPNLSTDIEGAVLRKRKLHLEVFFDDVSVGKGKCSLRGLLATDAASAHDVAVDVTDDAYHKVGRIFLNAQFSRGMDHETLAIKDEGATQKNLLMQIFNETGGPTDWKDTLLWNEANDVSTWGEVEVNTDNLVTELRLNYNNLTGVIPVCLGSIHTLRSLEMFGNKLTGEIPETLGNLTNLKRLYLNNNALTGNLPISLSKLTCLEELDVSQNQLSGPIPTELALPTLTVLVLSENNFTGPLPIEFTELFLLATFACDFVPYVDDRKMSSAWIEYQYNLDQEMAVADRETDFTSRAALSTLKDVLGEMSESSDFFDSWGSKATSVPGVTFDLFRSVSSIILRGMSLYGDLPIELCSLRHLVFLDMSKNNLQGSLPQELENLTSLQYLYLRENYIDGDAMSVICKMISLRAVDLSENQITGALPSTIGDMMHLEKLYLRENQLTGDIPVEIENLQDLIELDLSTNQLTGVIPDLSRNIHLSYLDLSSNQLSGSIPESVGSLVNLRFLSLSFNLFEGVLPTSLSRLQKLDEIQLVGTNVINQTEDIPKAKMMLKRRLPSLNHISL